MFLSAFAVTAALCLSIALIEAWILVALLALPVGSLSRLVPNRADLIRSHIDYLMMALFLFVFYGLCRFLGSEPAPWLIAAACFGSLFNPFGFFVHAVRPTYKEAPPAAFSAVMMSSCVATTLGFAATAWTIAIHAVR